MISARTLRTLFRYVLTGGTAAVVDLSIFTQLHNLGVPIALAGLCGSGVAVVVNYTLTSTFVFRVPLSVRGFFLFFVGALLGLAINNTITDLGAGLHLGFGIADLSLKSYQVAKICGIGVAFLFNFWLNSTFVFKSRGVGASSPQ
jgi:putative flippase GtrA